VLKKQANRLSEFTTAAYLNSRSLADSTRCPADGEGETASILVPGARAKYTGEQRGLRRTRVGRRFFFH